jgi:hypothetical protein|tara:strand:- start:76 stop:663 length:588 start_codon:yes stop_codon:yes gene_type:complete
MIQLLRNTLSDLIGSQIDSDGIQQRGIADKIEESVCNKIKMINVSGLLVEDASSKRSLEDIQVTDENGNLYKLDIKTHDINADFSMPNMVSVARLLNFYKEESNNLAYIFVDYKEINNVTEITNITIRLVEELSWDMLAIQNLGKGQLQIKDMNSELIFIEPNREEWINQLKVNMVKHYNKTIIKFQKYINSIEM